jgi:hypothetical protein
MAAVQVVAATPLGYPRNCHSATSSRPENTALACDSIGFREIGGDLNKVCVSEPGTNPDPDA